MSNTIQIPMPTKPYLQKFWMVQHPNVIKLNYSSSDSAFVFTLAQIKSNKSNSPTGGQGATALQDKIYFEIDRDVAFNKGINTFANEAVVAFNSKTESDFVKHVYEITEILNTTIKADRKVIIKLCLDNLGIADTEVSLETMIKKVYRYGQTLKNQNLT